jgi:OOP family OmpA-OmpF porin
MRLLTLVVLSLFALSFRAHAQESLEEKLQRKLQEKADQKTDEAIDEGLNQAEEGVKDAATKDTTQEKKVKKQKQQGEEAKEEEQPADDAAAQPASQAAAKPAFASYSKFDFVPGEQVVLFDDFSQDAVGDFPAKWNTNGSGEVVTLSSAPGKWLQAKGSSPYLPDLPGPLPENFTIEMDVVYHGEGSGEIRIDMWSSGDAQDGLDGLVPGTGGAAFRLSSSAMYAWNWKEGMYDINSDIENTTLGQSEGKPIRVSIWVQKQRARLYVNAAKVFDIPRILQPKAVISKVRVWPTMDEACNFFFSNVRIAAGAPDMRSKLLTEGKLVTRGITFDSGSDKIRPESFGTLKSIADVLKENASVKVKIVGHTDSDGTESGNLDLSKRRAAAVKNTLVSQFGIDGARLQTDGKGQSQPVAPNTTSEGKANNRRVELVKM